MTTRRQKYSFLIICLTFLIFAAGCGANQPATAGKSSMVEATAESIVNEERATSVAAETEEKEEPAAEPVADLESEVAPQSEAETEEASLSGNDGDDISAAPKLQIIKDVPRSIVLDEPLPEFTGDPSITLNHDIPEVLDDASGMQEGEIWLSALDNLERAGTTMMMAGPNALPIGKRGPTGQYKPSGWHQNKYPGVIDSEPPYLMNRGHLLMWAISGLTDTEENLFSATNYLNHSSMLQIENEVLDYIESSGDCVAYRVTPVFEGDNLLASGIIIEAAAVDGDFQLCRYVYNAQPGVEIDYKTGENHLADGTSASTSGNSTTGDTRANANSADVTPTPEITEEPLDVLNYDFIINKKTLRFHKPACDSVTEMKEKNKEGFNGTAEELIALGYDPCNKCCGEWVTPTATPEPTWEPTPVPQPVGTDYVLNTNTRKFHYPSCRSVKQMKPKNTQYYSGTRDGVIAMGYDPCQNCNP